MPRSGHPAPAAVPQTVDEDDVLAGQDTIAGEVHHRRRFDSPEQEAYLHLWRAYDRLKTLEEDLFARNDLTAQQYNVMRLLRAARPERIPTLALAARLISRAPDITRMLDKLEERGLVCRERPPDNRRIVTVGITAEGMALLEQLDPQVRECNTRMLGHIAPADLRRLVELLRQAGAPHETPESPWR